jgi:hypothetical protein
MSRARTLIAALVVSAPLALAACGGDGGVSTDDYADDLDAVCTEIEEQTQEIGQVQPNDPDQLSRQLDELREAIRSGIERMRDIERPDGEDGERAEEYVNQLEQAFEEQVVPALEDLESAVRDGATGRIREAAQRLQAIDEEDTQELARELGADECAEG